MTVLTRRDRLGADRIFYDRESGIRAPSLHALLARVPSARHGGLDPIGVRAAWGLEDAPDRTCFRAVGALPPGGRVSEAAGRVLSSCLIDASFSALTAAHNPVVALGGGIDAALAVLAARRAGITVAHAIHLSVPGTTYDERDAARETASALGLALHEIDVTAADLAHELRRAVRLAETPLYNLHPVSRVIVARTARERGHDALVTGDGADQACRGATERADYVPLVAAITRGSGLTLASPFLDEDVVELLVAAREPEKQRLRALARVWGLPAAIADRPKVASSAPPLPRAAFPDEAVLAPLAITMDRELAWSSDDHMNVAIASLAAFKSAFEVA